MKAGLRSALAAAATATIVGSGLVMAAPASATTYENLVNGNSAKCMGVANNKVGQYNCTQGENQLWAIYTVGGWSDLRNEAGQCLYLTGNPQDPGDSVQVMAGTCSTGNYAFQYHNDGNQTIAYDGDPSYVIGISAASKASGAHAITWGANGKSNQNWNLR